MKTKEILMIHCLVLLGIALIASLFKKVPGIVKNGSFFIAIVLLAVSQVLDETENLELESSCTTDSNQCKGETGKAFNNCCFEDENSCLGVYNRDGPNPICVCCPEGMEISQAWRSYGGDAPEDPCWEKAMPSKYGPACVPPPAPGPGCPKCSCKVTTDWPWSGCDISCGAKCGDTCCCNGPIWCN